MKFNVIKCKGIHMGKNIDNYTRIVQRLAVIAKAHCILGTNRKE